MPVSRPFPHPLHHVWLYAKPACCPLTHLPHQMTHRCTLPRPCSFITVPRCVHSSSIVHSNVCVPVTRAAPRWRGRAEPTASVYTKYNNKRGASRDLLVHLSIIWHPEIRREQAPSLPQRVGRIVDLFLCFWSPYRTCLVAVDPTVFYTFRIKTTRATLDFRTWLPLPRTIHHRRHRQQAATSSNSESMGFSMRFRSSQIDLFDCLLSPCELRGTVKALVIQPDGPGHCT